MGAVTLVIAIATYWKINRDFNKPSLIEAFYDGGFNGVGLDFKKNGTYIFDNFCMWSDYKYGTYNINGDIIELDDNVLNDLHISNRLKIMTVKDSLKDTVMLNKYIFQMDDHWNETKNVIKFRVTVDNR